MLYNYTTGFHPKNVKFRYFMCINISGNAYFQDKTIFDHKSMICYNEVITRILFVLPVVAYPGCERYGYLYESCSRDSKGNEP